MPELAEVAFASKAWKGGIGDVVAKVQTKGVSRVFRNTDPAKVKNGLHDTKLTGSKTHGKKMLFRFSDNRWLGLHLGMTGWLFTEDSDYLSGKHDALVLRQAGRSLIFRDPRQFGRVHYHQGKDAPAWWSDLPPEVTSDLFTFELVRTVLKRRSRSPVKAVLLMQEFFPGIGNWMVDEILWRARIHPVERAGNLSPAKQKALWEQTQFVANGALETVGKRGGDPPEDWLFHVRWKDGGNCPKLGKPLVRETVAGRTTCWCPSLQRLTKR
ncbi:MAG: DNA-formamidopyrimidine glycosylase [Opitutae bacterium]|jgi:formamidopyrimidine-DNA glycosylase|nr:DNA-formamidopyrimidine glycosylase [Opitutae bacterium]